MVLDHFFFIADRIVFFGANIWPKLAFFWPAIWLILVNGLVTHTTKVSLLRGVLNVSLIYDFWSLRGRLVWGIERKKKEKIPKKSHSII